MKIPENTCFQVEMTIAPEHLAAAVGSGDLPVFSTPQMIALMENCALRCVAPYLDENSTTVGVEVYAQHVKASPLGRKINCVARLEKQEGRKLFFAIKAEDEKNLIGEAKHIRFIVDRQKFMEKITQ